MKEQLAAGLGEGEIAEVVEDDEVEAGEMIGDAALSTGAGLGLELTPGEREALLQLGADVERAWHAEGATIATRKRIVRMLIEEIVVRVENDGLDIAEAEGEARNNHTACRMMLGGNWWRANEIVVIRHVGPNLPKFPCQFPNDGYPIGRRTEGLVS